MYRQRKTIEAACYLLSRLEGEMPYIKLIKLLYLADREQVRRRGRTISGDTHWSLKFGPILSETYRAIKEGNPSWNEFFETDPEARVVTQIQEAKPAALSRADREVLDAIIERFGHMRWTELVDFTHTLPEWEEVKAGRKRIRLYDIAKAVGYSDAEARSLVDIDQERDEIERFQETLKSPAYA